MLEKMPVCVAFCLFTYDMQYQLNAGETAESETIPCAMARSGVPRKLKGNRWRRNQWEGLSGQRLKDLIFDGRRPVQTTSAAEAACVKPKIRNKFFLFL